MTDKSSKKTDAFLTSDHKELGFIFDKIKKLNALNELILPLLDKKLQVYCQVANLTQGKLVMMVANGSIATHLRFQTADLIRKFKQYPDLQTISSIHYKVQPGFQQQRTKKENYTGQVLPPLSTETARLVKQIAESIENPELREVMKRIASRKKV